MKLDLIIFINIYIYFFACWVIFRALLSSADIFFLQKITMSNKKNASEIPPECQAVWIQIRADDMSACSGSKLFAKVFS